MGREWYKIQEKVIETVPDSSFLLVQSTPNGKGALNKINFITTGDFILSPPISSLILSIVGPHIGTFIGLTDTPLLYHPWTNAPVTVNATATGLRFDGEILAIFGGTGITSYTVGDMLYADSVSTLTKLAVGADTEVLTLAGGVPTWATAAATEDLEATLVAGNFTGANDMVMSTQLSSRIIKSDNTITANQVGVVFGNGGASMDVMTIGDPTLTSGGLLAVNTSSSISLSYSTTIADRYSLRIDATKFSLTKSGVLPDTTLQFEPGINITFKRGLFPFNGVFEIPTLTANQQYDFPDESGVVPVGEGWNTIIANAAAPEDGKVIAWDDGNSEYTLLAASVNTNIYTHDGTTGAGRTVTLTDTLQFIGGQVDVTAGTTDTGATVLSSEKADTTNIVEFNDRAQGRVNSPAFIPSAQFEVASSTRGFLPPRNTDPLANIPGPTEGLIAWDSTDNELQVFDSANWITLGDANNPKRTWNWGAARNNASVTAQYIRTFNGTPTNSAPYVVPFNCILTDITCSTLAAVTWNAQVHVNGASVAQIAVVASDTGTNTGLSVAISAGDQVAFYCDGTASFPHIQAWFKET